MLFYNFQLNKILSILYMKTLSSIDYLCKKEGCLNFFQDISLLVW